MAHVGDEVKQELPLVPVHLENVTEIVQPNVTACLGSKTQFGVLLVSRVKGKQDILEQCVVTNYINRRIYRPAALKV